MKTNDLKKLLKDSANAQEIHDLDPNFLSYVDKSKVKETSFIKKKKKVPFAVVLSLTSVILLFIGLTIGLSINKGNKNENIEPLDPLPYVSKDKKIYLKDVYVKEYYNLVNIAYNLDKISYDSLEKTSSKTLNSVEEEAIVNNIDLYVYNVLESFELETINASYIENKDETYNYERYLTVTSNYYTYEAYFTEDIISEKNVNEINYKMNANTYGVIIVGDKSYEFEGNETIKNQNIDFTTKLYIEDGKYVVIKETFSADYNEYIYEFYNNDSMIKSINLKEKFDDDGNVYKVETDNIWYGSTINKIEVDFTKSENYLLEGKIKSKNSDYIYISKNEDKFTYQFKNSSNTYVVD